MASDSQGRRIIPYDSYQYVLDMIVSRSRPSSLLRPQNMTTELLDAASRLTLAEFHGTFTYTGQLASDAFEISTALKMTCSSPPRPRVVQRKAVSSKRARGTSTTAVPAEDSHVPRRKRGIISDFGEADKATPSDSEVSSDGGYVNRWRHEAKRGMPLMPTRSTEVSAKVFGRRHVADVAHRRAVKSVGQCDSRSEIVVKASRNVRRPSSLQS
jgi:hypothetical protein